MLSKDKFDLIYEQYYKLMYQVVYRILKNTEDTEDALQEAFLIIAKNISKISDPICPKTRNFVVIISRNVSLTMLKRRKDIRNEMLSPLLEDRRIEIMPEKAWEKKTVIGIIKEEIRELPSRYRDCLYLSLVEGYTPGEIADMLAVNVQSIYKRLKRGKKKLQGKLVERGVTYEDK